LTSVAVKDLKKFVKKFNILGFTAYLQCCGSGFGIRELVPFDPWIWDPGWVRNQDPDPG
jgi:hypothetical protein